MEKEFNIATKAIILYKRKALIIQRSNYMKFDEYIWEVPGGRIEFGEDLHDCLKREVKEEVNVDVEIIKLLYATSVIVDNQRHVVILSYLCNALHDNVILSNEHNDFLWANKQQMREMLKEAIISDLDMNYVWDQLEID